MRKKREKVSISDFEIELKLHINNLYAAAASGTVLSMILSKVHCKSERSVLALKMRPFR